METITTDHPLRTMILRFDRSKRASDFETDTLQCYREIHDRVLERLQRAQRGRKLVPGFRYRIEDIERLFDLATYKFNHLNRMIPTNPVRDRVYGQLKTLLAELNDHLDVLVPELIDECRVFFEFEDYALEQDDWMDETAFPQFHQLFTKYDECSIDVVVFDLDLEDFKYELAYVLKQERFYLDEMGALIDDFNEVSNNVQTLFEQVNDFDESLLLGEASAG